MIHTYPAEFFERFGHQVPQCPDGTWPHISRRNVDGYGRVSIECPDGGTVQADHTDVPSKREFETGASRDGNSGKFELARFFAPEVIESQAAYMHKHREMKDGSLRDPDNWKHGIPRRTYMDSLHRHEQDLWFMFENGLLWRTRPDTGEQVTLSDALHGIIFNAMGMLYEIIKGRDVKEAK